MSKNIIAEYLIDGKIGDKLALLTDELRQLLETVCQAYDTLHAGLTTEQKVLFEAFCDAESAYHLENLERYFSEGFKVGILIAFDILNKK